MKFIAWFISLLCLTASYAWAETKANTMPITDLHRALASQTGWLNTSRPLTAEDLRGRIILLDFWTFCCINCMHVMPDLSYLEQTFGDKLTVIGVHSAKFANERDTENIRNAILRYDLHHPVVNDFDFSLWRRFGVNAWPTFMLITPDGRLAQVYSGEGNRAAAEKDIRALVKQYEGKLRTDPLPIALEKDKAPDTVLKFPGKIIAGELQGAPVLFISDSGHQRVVALTPQGKVILSIGSGNTGFKDGDFGAAQFNTPQGLAFKNGLLYIADTNNHALRVADLKTKKVTTLAGTGQQGFERTAHNAPALKTPLASPWDVTFYPDNTHLMIAMAGTHQLWNYDIANKTLSVVAGNGNESIDDGAYPHNSLSQPSGLSALGDILYFVDSETSALRALFPPQQYANQSGGGWDGHYEIMTFIGTGLFDFGYKEGKQGVARMQHPLGLFADASGKVYVADSYNHSIRSYDRLEGVLHNYAGHGVRGKEDGALTEASFNEPNGLTRIGDKFYIADTNNHAIRVIDIKAGIVSTLAVSEDKSSAPFAPTYAEVLPSLYPDKQEKVKTDKPLGLRLTLLPGWHVNEAAPSYFALFEMKGTAPVLIKAFDKDSVRQKQFTLPALKKGKTYRLQGSVYYCENKAGSQCLVKSFDVTLHPDGKGKDNLIYTLD